MHTVFNNILFHIFIRDVNILTIVRQFFQTNFMTKALFFTTSSL